MVRAYVLSAIDLRASCPPVDFPFIVYSAAEYISPRVVMILANRAVTWPPA